MVPGFASIRRIGAGLIAAPQGSGLGTIDRGAGPIELVGLLELGQEDLVQLLPDPGPLPGIEVVQAGHATATAHLLGQLLPGDARLEDEDDAGEDLSVIQGLAPGEPEATRLGLRQERFDALPEFVADKWLGHGRSSKQVIRPWHERANAVPFASFF